MWYTGSRSCALAPTGHRRDATYLLTKAQRMHHLLNLDAFAGVLPGGSNGIKPEPLHFLAPTTRARVHSASDGVTARPRPVETAGWVPVGLMRGLQPWCKKLLSITDTPVVPLSL